MKIYQNLHTGLVLCQTTTAGLCVSSLDGGATATVWSLKIYLKKSLLYVLQICNFHQNVGLTVQKLLLTLSWQDFWSPSLFFLKTVRFQRILSPRLWLNCHQTCHTHHLETVLCKWSDEINDSYRIKVILCHWHHIVILLSCTRVASWRPRWCSVKLSHCVNLNLVFFSDWSRCFIYLYPLLYYYLFVWGVFSAVNFDNKQVCNEKI